MPITDQKSWDEWVASNSDPYGKCCVDVARRVMELLDEQAEFDAHKLICQADDDIGAGGITGFMAGAVASMVSVCHSRGDEFKSAWNKMYQTDDEKPAEGVINPALISIGPA